MPGTEKLQKGSDAVSGAVSEPVAATSHTKAPLAPEPQLANNRPVPVAWSERFGSRLALIVLLAAVGFATFVAMNGQDDESNLGPLASDDLNLSLEEGTPALTDHSPKKSEGGAADASITANTSAATSPNSSTKVATKNKDTARSEASLNEVSDAPFALTPLENDAPDSNRSGGSSFPSLQGAEPQVPYTPPKTPLPDRPPHNIPGKSGTEPVMAKEANPVSGEQPNGEDELTLSGPLASRQPKSNTNASVANLEAPQSPVASRPQYPNTGYPLPDSFLRYLQTAPPAVTAGYGNPNGSQPVGNRVPGSSPGITYPQTSAPSISPPVMSPGAMNPGAMSPGAMSPGYAMPPGYAPSNPAYTPSNPAYAPPVTPAPTNPGTLPPAPNPF